MVCLSVLAEKQQVYLAFNSTNSNERNLKKKRVKTSKTFLFVFCINTMQTFLKNIYRGHMTLLGKSMKETFVSTT